MVSLTKLIPVFLRIGAYSFNAGASEALLGQIVEKKNWLSHDAFGKLMSVAALIPGPFHVNLVIAIGQQLAGIRGAIAAVAAFIFPGFMFAIGCVYALNNEYTYLWLKRHPGVISGLLSSVAGLLLSAIVRLGIRNRAGIWLWLALPLLAALLLIFHLPFAAVLVACGVCSVLWFTVAARRLRPRKEN